jgi:hypothetical protein
MRCTEIAARATSARALQTSLRREPQTISSRGTPKDAATAVDLGFELGEAKRYEIVVALR